MNFPDEPKINPASARWDAAQQLTVPAPVPILAPSTVLQLTEGTNTSVPLAITNAGAGMLNWILTSISYGPGASNWITSVSPTNGLVESSPGSTTVTVNRSALGPTPSTATLYFQSNGGPAQVTVVASELPPLFITNAPVPIPKTWFEQHGITENMEEAALADLDGDAVPTWKEYLADTDPTHANSVFRADHFETNNGSSWALHFSPSSPNRIYTLQKSADLHLGPWLNVPGQGPRQGTGGADSMILPAPTGAREFYRMTVELPE